MVISNCKDNSARNNNTYLAKITTEMGCCNPNQCSCFCPLNILGAKCSDHLSNDIIIRLELEMDFKYKCKDNHKLSQIQSNVLYPILPFLLLEPSTCT